MSIIETIDHEFERQLGAATAVFFEGYRDATRNRTAADGQHLQAKASERYVTRVKSLVEMRAVALEALRKDGVNITAWQTK